MLYTMAGMGKVLYGPGHTAERERWLPIVEAGGVWCARQAPGCVGRPISPGQPWDLGHTDAGDDRAGWTGPECVPCNRGAGGRNGAAVTNARRRVVSRDW